MQDLETAASEQFRDQPLLERYRLPVDSYMLNLLTQTPGLPGRMVEYHLGFRDGDGSLSLGDRSEGKAVRPTLCLLTVDAVGGNWERAVPAAAGLELFHNFTLIHDDIQDEDETRHGKPTVWKLWGKEQAINAGDAAHLLSSNAILGLQATGYSAEQVLQAHGLLTETGVKIVEGQTMDIDFERRLDVSVDEYMQMIRGKTGIFLESAIVMGALLGSASEDTTAMLREYGSSIGVAFQIADDALGIWGDTEKTGKPVGADIKKRKKTYPVVLALNQAEGSMKEQLEALYHKTEELDDADVERVLAIFDALDIRSQARAMTDKSTADAISSIGLADIDEGLREDYLALAVRLANRQK